jgi:hypothetical protein
LDISKGERCCKRGSYFGCKEVTKEIGETLMEKIAAASPKAIPFLDRHHKLKWSRSKFSKECKVDHANNNISECFNNWIKDYKDLPVADLMDKIREKITEKIYTRQEIANRMEGRILASVLHELNMKSRGLHYEILRTGAMSAEISGITKKGRIGEFLLTLRKEHVDVDYGRFLENHALMQ